MKNLFITSINPAVGKSTFTMALALRLRDEGHNIGYFKPITDTQEDTDAKDAKQLLGMEEDLSVINPVTITPYEYDMTDDQIEGVSSQIFDAYENIIERYDFLLIEGAKKMNYLSFLNLDHPYLAKKMNAKVLVVSSGEEIEDTDRLILAKRYVGPELICGSVFTLVPDQLFHHFQTKICPQLRSTHDIPVFGIIPNRGKLVAPTAGEIQSALGGRILAGEEFMNNLVEDYLVGAMEPSSALKHFRKSVNKAVITGGDRPQIAISALETDTSLLILTGSILPPASVIAKAEENQVPIILVEGDTFKTVEKLTEKHIYGKINVNQPEKIDAWNEIFDDTDYEEIVKLLEE